MAEIIDIEEKRMERELSKPLYTFSTYQTEGWTDIKVSYQDVDGTWKPIEDLVGV